MAAVTGGKLWIKRKIEINWKWNNLPTIHNSGNRNLVEKLCDKFVDANKAAKDGLTPLYVATLKGWKTIYFPNHGRLWSDLLISILTN